MHSGRPIPKRISYYPGCSLATTAKENNRSLISFCRRMGYELAELEDWNCCGSSSAHAIDSELAFHLPARNLSLAPPERPLLIACPNCRLRHRSVHKALGDNPAAADDYRRRWGRAPDPDLRIIHFFDLIDRVDLKALARAVPGLKGLRFVPYYGCMLAAPPGLGREPGYHGMMEKMLSELGAEPLRWGFGARCCGTFLSVTRPEVVTPMVDGIMRGARAAGAECLVTACAMCHLNLETRSSPGEGLPVLHLSEALALAAGEADASGWFSRHLLDPRPALERRGLLPA